MRPVARIVVAAFWLVCARADAQAEPSAEPEPSSAAPEAPPAPPKPSTPAQPESRPDELNWGAPETPPAQPKPSKSATPEPKPLEPDSRLQWEAPPAQPKPSQPAKPEAKPAEAEWGVHRVMGGHAFPLAAFVPTPFATSYISVRGGVEYHRVPRFAKPIALFDSGGSERVDLQTLSVTEAVDFEVRLIDWLAVFGSGYGRVRAGVDAPTLLGNGGDYRYGGDGGALVKLLRVGSFQLALRGQVGYYAGQQAGILGLFQDLSTIVNDALARVQQMPTLDLNNTLVLLNNAFVSATTELLTPLFGFRYGGSVNAALALNRYLGLQGAFGVLGDQTTYQPRLYDPTLGVTIAHDQISNSVQTLGALAVDCNGAPAGIPFDVMVEYSPSFISTAISSPSVSTTSSSVQHLLALGVYYSGRPDLQLGGTVYTLLGQVPVVGADRTLSGRPQDGGAQLVFHYIW